MQARLEADAQCLLVIIGATPEGKKEVVGLTDGVRESVQPLSGNGLDRYKFSANGKRRREREHSLRSNEAHQNDSEDDLAGPRAAACMRCGEAANVEAVRGPEPQGCGAIISRPNSAEPGQRGNRHEGQHKPRRNCERAQALWFHCRNITRVQHHVDQAGVERSKNEGAFSALGSVLLVSSTGVFWTEPRKLK